MNAGHDLVTTGIDAACASVAGKRPDNQDRCAVRPGLGVVSDGVGGHAGGARAAELTVAAVLEVLAGGPEGGGVDPSAVDDTLLAQAIGRANGVVRGGRRRDPSVAAMGATVIVAAATCLDAAAGRSRWLVAHVGDSPGWLVSAGGGTRLTHDHTLAAELLRAGSLTPADADRHPGRHVLSRSIGGEQHVRPDVAAVELGPGDQLVLASDGVADVLDAAGVAAAVAGAGSAEDAARALVDAALAAGTTDNVTTVVLRQVASSSA